MFSSALAHLILSSLSLAVPFFYGRGLELLIAFACFLAGPSNFVAFSILILVSASVLTLTRLVHSSTISVHSSTLRVD